MAGTSHNHTMNIGIKVDASGIGKTDSELKNLSNQINGLNGKKVDLQVNLGDKASKTIDSITTSIGRMEKSLNSISTKGIMGIQDAVSGATKSIDTLTSAIGSVQKSLDSISAKGLEDVSSGMGDITKSSADASSGVGSLSTAIQTVNIGNLEEVASVLGNIQTAAQDAGSSISQAMETSGFTDNWNNSYGGRYGGMRYTGQGIGLSNLVSAISGGKSSYELTIENAMSKQRNMGIASTWHEEDGVTGMDAYWALDAATNKSLMSLNTLAAGVNAYAATSGATAKDIANHANDLADFGTMVIGLGYTEDVAQTAVMKLARGLGGTFAALDQYGITKESLTATGKWNGDENDLDGYMDAVSEYSKAAADALIETPSGIIATMGKSASLGGYALGAMEAQGLGGIVKTYKALDDALLKTTKSLGWGATAVDNFNRKVWQRDTGQKDDRGEAIYESLSEDAMGQLVDAEGHVVYKDTTTAMAEGFSEKKTGFNLSTLIIGADQVLSTYKTVKDTVLGTFAEIKDIQRMRNLGFRKIFGGDFNRDPFGNIIDDKKEACEAANGDCPQARQNEKKKKKGLFGRTKDKIGDTVNNTKNNNMRGNQKDFSILNPSSSGNKGRFGKIKDKIGSIKKNPYSIISNPDFKGYDKPVELKRKPVEEYRPHYFDNTERANKKGIKIERIKKDGTEFNKFKTPDVEEYNRIHGPDYVTKPGSSSATFNRPYKSAEMSSTFERWKKEGELKNKAKNLNKDLDAKNKQRINSKDNRNSRITNKVSDKIGDFKNNVSSKKTGLQNYFSADNKQREAAGQQYNGYMKNVNKGLFDIKSLKTKSKQYLKTKKRAIQKEFAKGELKGLVNKRVYGDMARQAPYATLDKVTSGARTVGGAVSSRISDSAIGGAYSTIRNQGSSLKNTLTGSRVWSGASRVTGTMSSQIGGNAAAMYGMATGGKDIKKTRVGKAVKSVKQNGVVKSARAAAAPVVSRAGGAARTAGGAVMKGASAGAGAIASGVGKIGGLMSGIMGGLGAILGPVGMILMAVTLITGLLDAMGVDWMGPLQTAFGGFIEAMQPLIQGFGTWLADTATRLAPIITQIGQVLAPILGALGSLLSGGFDALGNVLGPILDGLGAIFGGGSGAGMFDGLADGLAGLGPIVSQLWDLMGQGAGGMGGFLGGILDGVGEYLTHIVQEFANTISMFWNTIAQGISTAIQTIGNGISLAITAIMTTIGTQAAFAITTIGAAFGVMFTLIGAGIGAGIAAIGVGTGVAIMATLGALGAGIALIGAGIGIAIASIGMSAGLAVASIGTGIGVAIAAAGMAIAMVITAISTAVSMGITAMATAITAGITMISQGIMLSFANFAMVVAAATASAYATLLAFQGSAVSLMGTIATDMVNAFTNNFHGIASAVDNEMRGAYNNLCSWGDKMVAKAGEIASRVTSEYESKSGIGSPGYIWRMTAAEWLGALGAMARHGTHMVSTARSIGTSIVTGYNQGYNKQPIDLESGITPPKTPDVAPLPTADLAAAPPKVEMPNVAKEIKENNKNNEEGTAPQVVFNHYGDLDNEARADKVLNFISKKMGFENKRAGRTVNRPRPSSS